MDYIVVLRMKRVRRFCFFWFWLLMVCINIVCGFFFILDWDFIGGRNFSIVNFVLMVFSLMFGI